MTISRKALLPLICMAGLPVLATGMSGPEDDSVYVVFGAERAAVAMAAWGDDGSAHGPSAENAPDGAVRYEAKMVRWPTATVKVLSFSADSGGVLHHLTDEKLLYVLEGEVNATVGGESVTLGTGDVASLPSGSLTDAGDASDAVVVAWTASPLEDGATPAVVRKADVEEANLGGGNLKLRRYTFPGNSVRAVGLAAGFKTNPACADRLPDLRHRRPDAVLPERPGIHGAVR